MQKLSSRMKQNMASMNVVVVLAVLSSCRGDVVSRESLLPRQFAV